MFINFQKLYLLKLIKWKAFYSTPSTRKSFSFLLQASLSSTSPSWLEGYSMNISSNKNMWIGSLAVKTTLIKPSDSSLWKKPSSSSSDSSTTSSPSQNKAAKPCQSRTISSAPWQYSSHQSPTTTLWSWSATQLLSCLSHAISSQWS